MRITAQDIMSTPPQTVTEATDLAAAAQLMLDGRIGCVLVIDPHGALLGIVTQTDYTAKHKGIPFSTLACPQVFGEWIGPDGVNRIYEAARTRAVGEIMSQPVSTVSPETPMEDVLAMMLDREIKHVPVVRDGRPLGMITPHDVLKLMRSRAGL